MNALANGTSPVITHTRWRNDPRRSTVEFHVRRFLRPADGPGPIRSVSGTRSAAGTRTGEGLLGHARILAPTLPFTHHNE